MRCRLVQHLLRRPVQGELTYDEILAGRDGDDHGAGRLPLAGVGPAHAGAGDRHVSTQEVPGTGRHLPGAVLGDHRPLLHAEHVELHRLLVGHDPAAEPVRRVGTGAQPGRDGAAGQGLGGHHPHLAFSGKLGDALDPLDVVAHLVFLSFLRSRSFSFSRRRTRASRVSTRSMPARFSPSARRSRILRELVQVVVAVEPGAARRTVRVDEAAALVDPQVLHLHGEHLGGHRDGVHTPRALGHLWASIGASISCAKDLNSAVS